MNTEREAILGGNRAVLFTRQRQPKIETLRPSPPSFKRLDSVPQAHFKKNISI